MSGFDAVEVLKAAYRQLCRERARFLQVVLEVGLREPFSSGSVRRLEVPDEFGPDEVRAALVWSRRRSDAAFERAWDVHRRLPMLGEEMLAGRLDEPRAVAFIRWTAGLTSDQAARVCELLLPQAPRWTVGELVEQIQRLVLAIDPQWAEKRYREAVRRRRVIGVRQEDGTATVSGLDLPMDRAAAGCERIDELARGCKRAGDGRSIDHIRVDLFLGSLDGSFEGLTDEQVVAHVLAHPFVDSESPADPDPDPDSDSDSSPAPGSDQNSAGNATENSAPNHAESVSGSRPQNHAESGPEDQPDSHGDSRQDSRAEPATEGDIVASTGSDPVDKGGLDEISPRSGGDHGDDEPCGGAIASSSSPGNGPDSTSAAGSPEQVEHGERPNPHGRAGPSPDVSRSADPDDDGVPGRETAAKGWAVGEVRVELTTLLGLDEHPAEVPGWGMVHAGLARRMVGDMSAGEWRFAICGDDGRLLHTGITRYRPVAPHARPLRDARRGGIVELRITQRCLDHLAGEPAEFDEWAGVLADLARQAAAPAVRDGDTRSSGGGRDGQASGRDRRQAGAALRRHIQIRGRVCSRPGCRVPATKTDQDHIVDWVDRGPSDEGNLHLACRHDHRAKHQGGWLVTLAEPGLIIWTSPLGHDYPSRLPPIMTPMPRPEPRNWPDVPSAPLADDDVPIMTTEPRPEPDPPSGADPDDLGFGRRSAGRDEGASSIGGGTISLLLDVPPF
ncbi:DUF222 domain-containing protein [Planotetraspora silvatica]|uniref:DUF222 domain-containing protein n=1 Tax=Planotetraspora silvatica TaxID=234614 RepID=UPI00194EBA99|nr:DUF222 domain-containing protein [Planotetraspora silvatica]